MLAERLHGFKKCMARMTPSALEDVATSKSEDAIHRCLGRTKGRATHIDEVIRGGRHCFQILGVGWGSRAANLKAEMAADG